MAKNMSQREIAKEHIAQKFQHFQNTIEFSRHQNCFGLTNMESPPKTAEWSGTETDQNIKSTTKKTAQQVVDEYLSNVMSGNTTKRIFRYIVNLRKIIVSIKRWLKTLELAN